MADAASPLASLVQLSLGQYLRRYHRHEIHIDAEIPEPALFVCNHGFGGVLISTCWRCSQSPSRRIAPSYDRAGAPASLDVGCRQDPRGNGWAARLTRGRRG